MIARDLAGARCLILGAGGFIGTNLCLDLARQGARVTAWGRSQRHGAIDGTTWITGVAGTDDLSAAVRNSDYVFQLIGSADPGASNRDPAAEILQHVPVGLSILDACRDSGIRRLVFLSSGGTVYRPRLPTPIEEDAPTDPVSAYGIGKLVLEKYCALYSRLYGLDAVVLRIANPFGPFQDPNRGQGIVAKLLKCALTGETMPIWGDGHHTVRDFVYIADVVDAIARAATTPSAVKLFNIGSGIGRSISTVIEDIADLTGRTIAIEHHPGRLADTPVNVLAIGRAETHLRWVPGTSWRAGLELTRDWMTSTI